MSEFDRIVGNVQAWWISLHGTTRVLIGIGALALVGAVVGSFGG